MIISEIEAAVKPNKDLQITFAGGHDLEPPINPAPSPEAAPSPTRGFPRAWLQPDPDAAITCPYAVYEAAVRYVNAGLSVIPIMADGSKSPDWRRLPKYWHETERKPKASWKPYLIRRARLEELESWRQAGGPFGLAVLGGAVSGGGGGCGLEIIDFDTIDLADPWKAIVARQTPSLLDRLVKVQSPRPGLHVYYRCKEFGGSQKLASTPVVGEDGKVKRNTLIELKGEGGYCIAPPSPRACHPRNKRYQLVQGNLDLTKVTTITPDERRILLDAARSLNRWEEPKVVRKPQRHCTGLSSTSRPGDDFNVRAEWCDILEPHGWTLVGWSGECERWCRPGKDSSISATVNYADSGLLYVFSSNADPFENDKGYTKFAAYTLLEHGGNFEAAARALRDKGYGRTGAVFQGVGQREMKAVM
jgi:hypothetical protein